MQRRQRFIEIGVPAVFGVLGLATVGVWIRSYLRAPQLPERPLGIELAATPASGGVPVASTASMQSTKSKLSAATTAAASNRIATSTQSASLNTNNGSAKLRSAAAPAPAKVEPSNAAQSVATLAVQELPGDWPGFRGADRSNVSSDGTPLAGQWPQGPKLLWSAMMGEGYAAAAVHRGRVYVLDYDSGAKTDSLRCFALADGREIWRQSYPAVVKRNHGMSRTIPAVTDRYVVSMGPKCHVLCTDAKTGAVRWMRDLVRDFGTTVPEWYAGQCPLLDGNRVILAPGGRALMAALDIASGQVLWQTPNPKGWQMTHSSILPVVFRGQRLYIYCGSGGVVGVSARDGSLLWDTTEWTVSTATVPTPVSIGDGRIFLTGGYSAGSMMLQMEAQGNRLTVKTLWRLPSNVFGSDQQTPIYYRGHIYGVIPGGKLACLDLNGRQVWNSGNSRRFGMGPYVIADGKIFVLDDQGTLTVAQAAPAGYRELGQARLLDGTEAWGPLAIVGRRLIARDLTRMVCVDIGRT